MVNGWIKSTNAPGTELVIRPETTRRFDVAIVGAGISGLALTYYLHELLPRHQTIALIEAHESVGGFMRTLHLDGWQVELGPNGFLDNRPPRPNCANA